MHPKEIWHSGLYFRVERVVSRCCPMQLSVVGRHAEVFLIGEAPCGAICPLHWFGAVHHHRSRIEIWADGCLEWEALDGQNRSSSGLGSS